MNPIRALVLVTLLLVAAACKDYSSPPPPPPPPPPVAFVTGSVTSLKLGALAVRVRGTSGAGPADSALTDSITGAYRALRLSPGSETVQVNAGPQGCTLPASHTAVVSANDTGAFNIVVDCGGAVVYGRLSNVTLGRLPGVTVSVTTDATPKGTQLTDRGGLFTFDAGVYGPGAGPFTITVGITSGLPANCTPPSDKVVSLARGGSVEVNFSINCT